MRGALHEAVDAQLLVIGLDDDVAQYRFRHALVQEAAYDELLPSERRTLHGAYARAIDARPVGGGAAAASRLVELAHHWTAAHEPARALAAAIDAGDASRAVYAYADAARQYERAIELWDIVPADDRPPDRDVDRPVRRGAARRRPSSATPARAVDPGTAGDRAGRRHDRRRRPFRCRPRAACQGARTAVAPPPGWRATPRRRSGSSKRPSSCSTGTPPSTRTGTRPRRARPAPDAGRTVRRVGPVRRARDRGRPDDRRPGHRNARDATSSGSTSRRSATSPQASSSCGNRSPSRFASTTRPRSRERMRTSAACSRWAASSRKPSRSRWPAPRARGATAPSSAFGRFLEVNAAGMLIELARYPEAARLLERNVAPRSPGRDDDPPQRHARPPSRADRRPRPPPIRSSRSREPRRAVSTTPSSPSTSHSFGTEIALWGGDPATALAIARDGFERLVDMDDAIILGQLATPRGPRRRRPRRHGPRSASTRPRRASAVAATQDIIERYEAAIARLAAARRAGRPRDRLADGALCGRARAGRGDDDPAGWDAVRPALAARPAPFLEAYVAVANGRGAGRAGRDWPPPGSRCARATRSRRRSVPASSWRGWRASVAGCGSISRRARSARRRRLAARCRRRAEPRRARRSVRADRPRTRGPGARRRGLHQPADRRHPVHQREHGRRPRLAHPGQARRRDTHRGRDGRRPARARRDLGADAPQSRSRLRSAALTRSSRLSTPTSASAARDASRASPSE